MPSLELCERVGHHGKRQGGWKFKIGKGAANAGRLVPRAQGDRGALILNDEMRELITSRADPHAQGHRGEERHALPARGRARGGAARQTTLEEINRVTFVA